MYFKQLFAPLVGPNVADIWSAAKIRFAQWCGESFYFTSIVRGNMKTRKNRTIPSLFIMLTLTLMVAAFWVSPAAMAAEKKMVKDPTTGKMVSAPEYGGTITYGWGGRVGEITDPFFNGLEAGWLINGVNERLGYGNWALDRDTFDLRDELIPMFAYTGNLAESWETPDPLTYVFHIRQGIRYALNPDSEASGLVNGREFTADDVVFTYQRNLGLGDFTERTERLGTAHKLPWASVDARDKYTVVMKMTKPVVGGLHTILESVQDWILPPEVIERYGDYKDWQNVVGTGPWMLTDYVEGASKSFIKNPAYWGFDEKYPENRLPYADEMRAPLMPEEATRISALRTGKVDIVGNVGVVSIASLDVVRSIRKTNPKIVVSQYFLRALQSFALNIRNAPFDDIRVRHALQMALDLETINETYYDGFASWVPMGLNRVPEYHSPFEEWPAELKQYYTYDPQGAEKLLDEAGYPRGADGVRLKTTLQHRDVIDLGYVEIAASYWADIGVEVTIDIIDTAALIANRTDASYEMITGDLGFLLDPAIAVGFYRPNQHVYALTGGVKTPELTAAFDAFFAATTVEEQKKASIEFDMAIVKQHNQIWGPLAPQLQASQPWLAGFNGEAGLGSISGHTLMARLWIDQDLKREMGF